MTAIDRDLRPAPEVAVVREGAERLSPLDRLNLLADEGSLRVIRSEVTSERMGAKARPGDGVIGGSLRIAGRPAFAYAQDAAFMGGSLGAQHADTIVRIQRLARQARVPVIGFVESGGARMQEGLAALNGYARIFSENVAASGVVPQISIITGTSAGGGSYSPALTDFVVMTQAASMFLTGPGVVREVMGEDTTAQELGGPRVHGRNGVCDFTVANDVDAIFLARQLLTYLPASAGEHLPLAEPLDPAGEEDPGDVVPLSGRKVYDVRAVIDSIADAGSVLEASPKWAPNIVTAFARIEGGPVGIVANQPRYLGGVIDVAASQKGASFIRTCNQYGVPLVALVDTPGFLPGSSQESAGVIRHGATLLHAFAASTVPRFTVVLRKAFGGAYITMNSKDLGADLYLAWNRAELGIMGAEQAVGVVHRRALAAAPDPGEERRRLADEYADEHLSARAAARTGAVDEIIEPSETRTRLAWALSTMTRSYQPARLRAAS